MIRAEATGPSQDLRSANALSIRFRFSDTTTILTAPESQDCLLLTADCLLFSADCLLVRQRRDAGESDSREELERSSAAGRDMRDL